MEFLKINEVESFNYDENAEKQFVDLFNTDLSDFEATQVIKYIKKHFTNDMAVTVEITEFNVFFLAKTDDGRDFLYNMAHRVPVLLESGDIVNVLSTNNDKQAIDYEVKLL